MTHIDDVPADARERIQDLVRTLEIISNGRKKYDEEEKRLKELLIVELKEVGVDYVENGSVEVRYIPLTAYRSVDSKRLEEDLPDIFEEYSKPAEKKEHIRVSRIK